MGDIVLQAVGDRLRCELRADDTIARLGGDEFGLLLPGADVETARGVAARLRTALGQPILVDGVSLDIGASVGIVLGPDHGRDAATLMRRADLAMYAAKRSGEQVVLYSSELDRDNDFDSPSRRGLKW